MEESVKYEKETSGRKGKWDGRQLATAADNTRRNASEGTDPKRQQRHDGNAAVSVTPHAISEHESDLHSYLRTTLRLLNVNSL